MPPTERRSLSRGLAALLTGNPELVGGVGSVFKRPVEGRNVTSRDLLPSLTGQTTQSVAPSLGARPAQNSGGLSAFREPTFGEHFRAGARGITVEELLFRRAQAQAQQLKAQQVQRERQRIQAAERNFEPFKKKFQLLKPVIKQVQREAGPDHVPSIGDIINAGQRVGIELTPTDIDTASSTESGRALIIGSGILPSDVAAKSLQTAGENRRKAVLGTPALQDLTQVNPQTGVRQPNRLGRQAEASTGIQLPRLQPSGPPADPRQIALNQRSRQPTIKQPQIQEFAPGQQGAPQFGGGRTGEPSAGLPPSSLQFPQPIIDPNARLSVFQRRAIGDALDLTKGSDDITLPVDEANRRARVALGPLLANPSEFTPFTGSVSAKEFNATVQEFGKNLRSSTSQDSQTARQRERIAAQDKRLQSSQSFQTALQRIRTTDKSKLQKEGIDQRGSIRTRLQQLSQDHQLRLQQNNFTAREQVQRQRDDQSMQRLQARLTATTNRQFDLQRIRIDAQAALQFSRIAQQQGEVTARGVLTSVLKQNPSLGPQLLERLTDPTTDESTFESITGALQDFEKSQRTASIQQIADDIIQSSKSDARAKARLKNKASTFPDGSPERKFLSDLSKSLESTGSRVTINNNPEKVDRVIQREQQKILASGRSSIETFNQLEGEISAVPISGLPGLAQTVTNFFAGTQFDIEKIRGDVDAKTFNQRFRPELERGKFLANVLRYTVAKTLDPSGRLSNQDIENVNLGVSAIRSTPQLEAAIESAKSFVLNRMRGAASTLKQGFQFEVEPVNRDLLIDTLSANPQVKDLPLPQLVELVQLQLLQPGSDVFVTETEALDIAREIKKRGPRRATR